jgi:hypothetical protein
MAKKEAAQVQPAGMEEEPVDMTGFALSQIVAWTNRVIIGCKEQLEVETKGNTIAHLQGQIPGCEFLLKSLGELFHLDDDFMADNNVRDYASFSFEELLGAQIDIRRLETEESWVQFLALVEKKSSGMKDFLLCRAKKPRLMFEKQGEYEGMTTYKSLFTQIDEMLNFRRKSEPLFHPDPDASGEGADDDAADGEDPDPDSFPDEVDEWEYEQDQDPA